MCCPGRRISDATRRVHIRGVPLPPGALGFAGSCVSFPSDPPPTWYLPGKQGEVQGERQPPLGVGSGALGAGGDPWLLTRGQGQGYPWLLTVLFSRLKCRQPLERERGVLFPLQDFYSLQGSPTPKTQAQ